MRSEREPASVAASRGAVTCDRMASASSIQLFCLPYAGASASVYGRWQARLPGWIDVCPIELPGRGRNIAEPPATTVAEMVEGALAVLRRSVRGPFALFGHSLGAVLAFELACRLEASSPTACSVGEGASNTPLEPLVVFASGTDAPSRRDPRRYANLASDAAILAELERLAGTPDAVLADAELMELVLPILRADFAACAAYRADRERRVRCPIEVFGGVEDTTTAAGLEGWRDHTRGEFTQYMFAGGHFFIHDQVEQVLEHVVRRVDALRVADGSASTASAEVSPRERSGLSRARSARGSERVGGSSHG
jgi:surfactin synthase thioesterase subunit